MRVGGGGESGAAVVKPAGTAAASLRGTARSGGRSGAARLIEERPRPAAVAQGTAGSGTPRTPRGAAAAGPAPRWSDPVQGRRGREEQRRLQSGEGEAG
jgi:hypothetical protein